MLDRYFKGVDDKRVDQFIDELDAMDKNNLERKNTLFQQKFTEEERDGMEKYYFKKMNREITISFVLRLAVILFYMYVFLQVPKSWGMWVLVPVSVWLLGSFWSKIVGVHKLPEIMWTPIQRVTYDVFSDAVLFGVLMFMIMHPL